MSHEPTVERYSEIAAECIDILGLEDIFAFIDDSAPINSAAMDRRLQEVMMDRQRLHEGELAAYLRYTCTRADQLPTWQPLLNAAIELTIQRGRHQPGDLFYGLLPQGSHPARNTGQPVYKPHQT